MAEPPHEALQHFVAHFLHRPLDGALEPERVGRAVTLHDDASQAEQSRAVEAARIEPLAERVEHRHDDHAGEPGEDAAHELLADEAAHHLHHSLGRLEHDVADEAVAHYHVGFPLVDSVAFDVADEIEPAFAQHLRRLLHHLVAFDILLADVEQADARPVLVLYRSDQRRPHDRELQQMLRPAIDVGAEIEDVGGAAHAGQRGDDRGAVDARKHLENEARHRHQRPRVTGADTGLRFAVLDEVYRDANRRILLVAQRESWRFVHQHDLARVVNPKAWTGFGAARLQLRLDGVAQAHQDDVDVRVGFQEIERRRHGDVRTMIAAHAIDGYCDFHEARCEAVPASLNARGDPDSVRSLRPDEAYSLLVLTTFLPR